MADGIQSGAKRWLSGTTKKVLDYASSQGKVGRPKQYVRIPTAVIPSELRPSIDLMERGIRPDLSGVGSVTSEGSEKVIKMPSASVNLMPDPNPTMPYSTMGVSFGELGTFQPLADSLRTFFNQLMPIVPYLLLFWLVWEMMRSFRPSSSNSMLGSVSSRACVEGDNGRIVCGRVRS